MRKLLAFTNLIAFAILVLAIYSASASAAPAATRNGGWAIDAPHTEVNFSIKHFFTPVSGTFRDFEIDLDYDPAYPENSSVEARIAIASVDTGNERRDNHLRSGDWFEADKYPYMTFKSTRVERAGENQLVAIGDLTIKGETRQVELPIKLLGVQMIPEQMQEMLGGSQQVASFKAETSIDRADFGVGVGSWAATMVVGGNVNIELLVEAHLR